VRERQEVIEDYLGVAEADHDGLSCLASRVSRSRYGHVEALRGIDMALSKARSRRSSARTGRGKTSALMAIPGWHLSRGDIRSKDKPSPGAGRTISPLGITTFSRPPNCSLTSRRGQPALGGYTRLPRNRVRVAERMEREMTRSRSCVKAGQLAGARFRARAADAWRSPEA